jgi:hypothetical protein
VGSFRTTTVSGQTEDSAAKRYVWNYYNRVRAPVLKFDSTDSWSYTSTTIRQANGAAANQVDIVVGLAETTLDLLGYGKPSEATIDQVNIWMRSTPWYQQQLRAWGQDPGHPTLTKAQSRQILREAQANGVVVDEGDMEVDNHGNFNPKGHKLRNVLVVAGIAGAAIATMGAAGVFDRQHGRRRGRRRRRRGERRGRG